MLLKNVKVLRPKDTKIQAKGKHRYVYKVIGQRYIKDKKYTVDERKAIGCMIKIYNHDVYLHLYYDNIKAQRERNAYLKNIDNTVKILDKHLESKEDRKEDLRAYDKKFYLRYDLNGYFISYKRKDEKIKEVIVSLGFFALVSLKKMSAKDALMDYRDRNVVEKMFRSLQLYLDYDSSLKTKTFIVFIASIVRSIIWHNIKDKKNYTIPSSLRELEKVEVTKGQNGIYRRTSALNSKNKKILTTFNIDENQIDIAARNYPKGL